MVTKKAGFTRRDLVWLMGFGFFVEAVAIYMLLIDPATSRLAKLKPELARVQEAHSTMQGAMAAVKPAAPAQAVALPEPMRLGAGESPSLAIQRLLDVQVAESGARLLSTTLEKPSDSTGDSSTTQAKVRLEGSYEAIDAFVRRLGNPDRLVTMEALNVRAVDEQAERLEADIVLSFHFQAKEH